MIWRFFSAVVLLHCVVLTGCGYHRIGSATHLPPNARTLAVPMFATQTQAYHTEAALTNAVIREFSARSGMRVTTSADNGSDVVLSGVLLDGELVSTGFLRLPPLRTMVAEQRAGRSDQSKQLWQLVSMELWYRSVTAAGVAGL